MENFYKEMQLFYLIMLRNLKKLFDYEPKLSHSIDRQNHVSIDNIIKIIRIKPSHYS